MTKRVPIKPGPAGDVLNVSGALQDGKTEELLGKSLTRARLGLLNHTGVNEFEAAPAADFLVQMQIGLCLLSAYCEYQVNEERVQRMEATTPAAVMKKARQMADSCQFALEQLELPLYPTPQIETTPFD